MMITDDLLKEQLKIEEDMRANTIDRYYSNHKKAAERGEWADTHAGRSLFDHTYDEFLKGIEEWCSKVEGGGAGRRSSAYNLIKDFGDNKSLAYVYLKTLINGVMVLGTNGSVHNPAKRTRVVMHCVQAIHDELRMRYFEENRRPLMRAIVRDFNERDLPRRRRREMMIRTFQKQQLEWNAKGWDNKARLTLGLVLLDIFTQRTGLIEEHILYEGPRSTSVISFTTELLAAISERMEKASNLFTLYYPTVIPPKPWKDGILVGGGYYTDNVAPYKFVKGAKMKYISELENRDMSSIVNAVNAMQATPWMVNETMLDVLEYVFTMKKGVKGVPLADPREMPPEPAGIEENEEIRKQYSRARYLVLDHNRREISKRIAVLRTISLAHKFKGRAIYFPYDLDSRGRAYPKPPFLNPQGTDYVKGLLEFHEGKPIETEEHAAYLAIAVANAWGHDKLPLQERVDWVEENEGMLCEIARDPKGDLRWTQADEPFMALRGALEWAAFCDQGWGFESRMPVHFDATCSGLQHFSAILRDEVGGFHVNLTACEERQDIYGAVAKLATETLQADPSDEARIALEIGVTRSLCKRPVMIVPYAGTFSSCMEYVSAYYKDLIEAGEALPVSFEDIRFKVTPVVAKHVWEAISNTVIAARGAMDWITHTAKLASKDQKAPLQWTTPDGFVVQQAKYNEKNVRVTTVLDGSRRIKSTIIEKEESLDPRKMSQSLSPNYIHSLDACHLRMSINRALELEQGMSFAMIHDSFGVHASDMPVFVNECIKPAFVEMYRGNALLETLRRELTVSIPEEELENVRPLPRTGNLDIEEVLGSQFFFS
jgi:DNA-directed RNA polymerase